MSILGHRPGTGEACIFGDGFLGGAIGIEVNAVSDGWKEVLRADE